jgi:P pilus assembly chaperone PapD
MYKSLVFFCGITASGIVNALPQINIGTMHDFIDGDRSTLLKRISNRGDQTAFVRTQVAEILYQADGKKQEKPIDAKEAAKGNIDGLVFTPSRMIIPANGMQSGRMLFSGNRDRERYYRVRFIPVMPKNEHEFGQTKKEYTEYKSKLTAGVTILTGYGAIIIVRPKNTKFNTTIDQIGKSIVITNKGNSSISLDGIKQCVKEKCSSASYSMVLPGSKHTLKIEANHSLQFTLLEGSKKTSKSFD